MTLESFFRENPAGALALSGGTDSSCLAWAAAKFGRGWRAYYVKAAFQPAFELRDARRAAELAGIPLTVIEADVLAVPEIAANPENRCYFCKRALFSAILSRAAADGYTLVIDGTNASDDVADRPGMQALRELSVRSPLRECGLTKADVRALSKDAGLFTWAKPSYACLATRIPTGTAITQEALQKIERGEDLLFMLGFSDFRIRLRGGAALLQFPEDQLDEALLRRGELLPLLAPLFSTVSVDLRPRRASD